MSAPISTITRSGQVTIPKKIRSGRLFSNASAVSFEERGNEIVMIPIAVRPSGRPGSDFWPLYVQSNQDWLDPVNDDLVKLPKNL